MRNFRGKIKPAGLIRVRVRVRVRVRAVVQNAPPSRPGKNNAMHIFPEQTRLTLDIKFFPRGPPD